jgi:hypothetical protein
VQVHFAEHACAAFDIAWREQDLQEVQRLITAGANLDEQDGMGHTPLHVAAGSEEPGSGAGLSGCSQRQRFNLLFSFTPIAFCLHCYAMGITEIKEEVFMVTFLLGVPTGPHWISGAGT